jgi:1-acyl-sn-glycerol-3-phosphate acyltransferase
MFRLLNGLFLPLWTAAVTVTAVTIAKLRRNHSYVTEGERFWARGLLKAWGVEVTAEHLERLPRQGPYILMANHQSHADVPILFASLPLIPGFLAKKELARIPFLSMALRNGGHVLIDRASRNSAREALKVAASEIQAGKTIAIFPEGTRGGSDALGEFKKGGFLIAKKAGVPVVPVGILGSRAVWHRDAWLPRAGCVRARVGEPITPEMIEQLSVDGLCARVRATMLELLGWPETAAQPLASQPPLPIGAPAAADVNGAE